MSSPAGRLNARERRLLAATIAVLAVGGIFLGGRAALSSLRSLETSIADRELEIEGLAQQQAQAGAVNAAYDRVVQQHSSALTVAQIHDNLRREIVRLTQVPLPATEDQPARTMNLVRIPALQEGQLTQGDGHREYQIQFQIPGANLEFLLAFLERVESSEQLLRIDNVEISRASEGKGVSASLEITRTVLDDPNRAAGPLQ